MDLMLVFVLFLFYISFSLFQGIDESVLHIFEFVLGYLVLILSCISVTPNTSISNMFIHYSLGLLAGSIVRVLGYIIPTINSFILSMGRINTVSTGGILYTRFAGLDIDPNYYAIQVLLAISLNILVIFYVKRRRTLNIIITISLVVFGLLSFSKMYILTILILNILIVFMLIRKNIFNAFIYLTSILVLSIIILNQFGNYFYNAYLTRFVGQGNSLGDLTTGRTEIWNGYLQDILEHLKILFFGNGLANGFFNGELSHNMYILALYQIGIIGIIIYLILLVYTYKTLKISTSINNKIKISLNIIPLLMLIIPNFALDSFAMDYFPIQLFLVMMSLQAGKIDKKFEVLLNEN
ncbi:hypothetical protein [Heyndrickxia acidicola]|nr:hypothetical protein [Heyndrickxia acidicola]